MTIEEKLAILENRILILEQRLNQFTPQLPSYPYPYLPGTFIGPFTTFVANHPSDRSGNT